MLHDEEEAMKMSERAMIRTMSAHLDEIRTQREAQASKAQAESASVALLRFISDYRRTHGWSPSQREIAEGFLHHRNPSHAKYCLDKLVEAGLLHRERGPRCLAITKRGRAVLEGVQG